MPVQDEEEDDNDDEEEDDNDDEEEDQLVKRVRKRKRSIPEMPVRRGSRIHVLVAPYTPQ